MSARQDLLGELVRAAGSRAVPEREEYERVLRAATAAWHRSLRARRRRRWALALAASVLAATVGVATFLHLRTSEIAPMVATVAVLHGNVAARAPQDDAWRPLQPGAQIVAGSRIRSGAEAGLALTLEGGISARLDKHSEMQIESTRLIRLTSGALYVDTGSAQPPGALRVETPLGTVSDVGTVFQIRAEPGAVRVRVREGRVQLDVSRSATLFESAAGEEITLNEGGSLRRGAFPASDPAWAWAEALALAPDIDGRPLLQFLTWVAHETGRRVEYQGPAVEAQVRTVILHGQTHDLTPLQALDLMLSTTDLEYVLSTDDVILIRRRED